MPRPRYEPLIYWSSGFGEPGLGADTTASVSSLCHQRMWGLREAWKALGDLASEVISSSNILEIDYLLVLCLCLDSLGSE